MTKGERTKVRILEAAADLIADQGTRALTVRALADQAELTTGAVVRYFPRSAEIFAETLKHIFAIGPFSPRDLGPVETLVEIARINFEVFMTEKPHYYRVIVLSYGYVGIDAQISRLHRADMAAVIKHRIDVFKSLGQERKRSWSARRLDDLARAYVHRGDGGLLHCSMLATRSERTQFQQRFLNDLRDWIDSL